MALVLADRVKETSTTTGTGTYTLAGAVSGFETFGSIGNGNTTYYACTLGADFEVGIGTYTSSGTTLARTTILQSSNSDNAVDWGAGTKTLFCTQPAEKAVFLNASDDLELNNKNITLGDSTSGNSFANRIKLGASGDLKLFHDGNNSFVGENGNGGLYITGSSHITLQSSDFGETYATFNDDGAVSLRHDNSVKFSTSSTGASITGDLTLTSTADNGAVLKLVSDDPSDVSDFGIEGQIQFFAENDASESLQYYGIQLKTADVTDGSEDGWLYFNSTADGSLATANALGSDGTFYFLGNGNASNAVIKWFQTRGTSNNVSLAVATPTADRTITLPDASGTVLLTNGDGSSLTNVNATTLDSIDSTSFLRSDAADTKTSGNLDFSDNVQLRLGTGFDLRLYHDASDSYIYGTTGNTLIQQNGFGYVGVQGKDGVDGIRVNSDDSGGGGNVELYHVGSKKLETTSTGATITGTAKATTAFQVDGVSSGSGLFGAAGSFGGAKINASAGSDATTFIDFDAPDISASGGDIFYRFGRGTTEATDELSALVFYAHDNGNNPIFQVTTNSDLTLTSYDAGATENPTLDLYRNSASPAANDIMGEVVFSGENSAGEKVTYSRITSQPSSVTDGSESDRLQLRAIRNGTEITYLECKFDFVTLNKPLFFNTGQNIVFEGSTSDDHELTLTPADPTSDRTITLPDATGTVLTTGNSDAPTTTTSSGDADFVLVDDGGTMKKITPTNLGIGGGGGGITVEEEGSALSTTATTLNFTGNGVTASGTGATKTIAVNGNEVLISSGTVSNVASIDFDSSVVTGFEQYRVVLYNVTPTTDTRELRMRLGTSNTAITSSIYQSALFQYGMRTDGSQRSSAVATANNTFLYLTAPTNDMGNNTGENLYAEILLPNPNSTSGYKHVVSRVSNFSYFPAIMGQRISAMAIREQSAINFITFFAESGTIATASFRLYGIS